MDCLTPDWIPAARIAASHARRACASLIPIHIVAIRDSTIIILVYHYTDTVSSGFVFLKNFAIIGDFNGYLGVETASPRLDCTEASQLEHFLIG
jgi:hypothetical protein